jgi:hypothetical protein
MLKDCLVRPDSVDRIRESWIAPAIEQYVQWLGSRAPAANEFKAAFVARARFLQGANAFQN